jgi:predicted lipid-binding transport protein (Tim44 family)
MTTPHLVCPFCHRQNHIYAAYCWVCSRELPTPKQLSQAPTYQEVLSRGVPSVYEPTLHSAPQSNHSGRASVLSVIGSILGGLVIGIAAGVVAFCLLIIAAFAALFAMLNQICS